MTYCKILDKRAVTFDQLDDGDFYLRDTTLYRKIDDKSVMRMMDGGIFGPPSKSTFLIKAEVELVIK